MLNVSQEIIEDPVYGFLRLEPIPSDQELIQYYQSKYYHILRKGDRAPQIARLLAGGPDASTERKWLSATTYDDVANLLTQFAPGRHVLDVGCGIGELISDLRSRGFDAVGVEPSHEAAEYAHEHGLSVTCGQLSDVVSQKSDHLTAPFDAVLFMNVLEHAPEPSLLVTQAKELLSRNGVLIVKVPNDFSDLQKVAAKAIGQDRWWVVRPDHINYFNFHSLTNFLKIVGFDTLHKLSDFPMELFLLMGDDYVSDRNQGPLSHYRRRRLELALPSGMRRLLYQRFAEQGIGRSCIVCCRSAN